jgi:hypothetical protein
MTRWLLNQFSTPALVLVVGGGLVGSAVVGLMLVRKVSPIFRGGAETELSGAFLEVIAAIYGIVVAFVIVALWEARKDAETMVASEATALNQMVSDIRAFPVDAQIPMERAIGHYVHAVAEHEWRTMRDGRRSERAAGALETLFAVVQSYNPQTGSQSAFYDQLASKLDDVTSNRRGRLQHSSQGLPILLQVLILAGGVIFIPLTYLGGPFGHPRIQLLLVGVVSALVAFSLLLTIVLDHPFSGTVAISNEPYKVGSLALYWADKTPRDVKGGEASEIAPEDLVGVWTSDAFGVTVFRQVGSELRGVLRIARGTIAGSITDGVFRGWWCEEPTRQPPGDAGEVEWRLAKSEGDKLLAGKWRYGAEGAFRGGWDLRRVGGPEPTDLEARFDAAATFCHRP